MEVMIFLLSAGFIVGIIAAGIAMTLHDRQVDESGLWYNEDQNIFYFRD